MKKSILKAFLPQIILLCAAFYLLPLPALLDRATMDTGLLTYALLIIFPAICFLAHMIFALKRGFVWYLPLLTGAFFAPTVLLYYNVTAIVYIFSYIVLSYIAAFAGLSVYKNNRK